MTTPIELCLPATSMLKYSAILHLQHVAQQPGAARILAQARQAGP